MRQLKVNDFDELNKFAYEAALAGQKVNYDKDWEEQYINIYSPETTVWEYKKVINLYCSLLSGEKTESEVNREIKSIQKKYEKVMKAANEGLAFIQAMVKAFEDTDLKQGTVEFKCPVCGGQATVSKIPTPDCIAHDVGISVVCQGCGFGGRN